MALSEKLLSSVYSMQYENLSADVVEKTKLCIIHSMSCAYAGIHERWSIATREMTHEFVPDGRSSIWFSNYKTSMAEAAFTNAVYAQSILYEDIHRDSNSHPGIIIIPTALAVAETVGASTKKVIAAIVAGYETMALIGRGAACQEFSVRGFRPTSIVGVFGSCVTAGRLLGLTFDQQLAAFAIAASFASGINQWAIEGTEDLYIQNGNAARGGIIAAQLAKKGVTAPRYILEGKSGACVAYGLSQDNLEQAQSFTDHWAILDVLYKPAPACALVQTTAQVALDILHSGVTPDDVANGTIYTFFLGKNYAGCDNKGPFDSLLQARMSNQFNFAASLTKKGISNKNYYDFKNATIECLANKLNVVETPEYTRAFPQKQPVRVELTLHDGTHRIFYKEEPVYLGRGDVIAKLYEHCQHDFSDKQLEGIVNTALSLECLPEIGILLDRFKQSVS